MTKCQVHQRHRARRMTSPTAFWVSIMAGSPSTERTWTESKPQRCTKTRIQNRGLAWSPLGWKWWQRWIRVLISSDTRSLQSIWIARLANRAIQTKVSLICAGQCVSRLRVNTWTTNLRTKLNIKIIARLNAHQKHCISRISYEIKRRSDAKK